MSLTCMLPMEQHLEKLTHTSALQLYRLPRSSQLPGTLALTGMNEPHHRDLPLVVSQNCPQCGGGKQHPTVLEALTWRVPSHGPKINLTVIAPWEIPIWAAQILGCHQPSGKERMGPVAGRDWSQFKYYSVLHLCQSDYKGCRGPS